MGARRGRGGGRPKLSREDKEAIAAESEAGYGAGDIAARHGVSRTTVYNVLSSLALEGKLDGGRRLPESAVADRAAGMTIRQVAEKYGVSMYRARADLISLSPASAPMHRLLPPEAAEEYAAGASISELARKYRASNRTITNCLVSHGVKIRKPGGPGRRSPRTAERDAAMVAEYEAGASAREIARKYGVTETLVHKKIRDAGVSTRLKKIDAAKVAEMRGAGMTARQIAAELGCSEVTVYAKLKEAGVTRTRPVRDGGSIRWEREKKGLPEQAAREYEAGDSLAAVAARYGMSPSCARGALGRMGVKVRNPAEAAAVRKRMVRDALSEPRVAAPPGAPAHGRLTELCAAPGGKVTCLCSCGNVVTVARKDLEAGRDQCAPWDHSLLGMRFGKLEVLSYAGSANGCGAMYLCRCDCGKLATVGGKALKTGNTSSCGCGEDENRRANVARASARSHAGGTHLNSIKSSKLRSDNRSGVRGVWYDERYDMYKAQITFKKHRYDLGHYATIEEAAEARREAERELFDPELVAAGLPPTDDAAIREHVRQAVEARKKGA